MAIRKTARKKAATSKKRAKKGRSPRKTARPRPGVAGRAARIRMYNVGFGDAFLVQIPHGGSELKLLFDCGSIEAAADVAMSDIVEQIVDAVRDADGVPRIDVVVATHRHKDHVSGFANALWSQVEVKEVWMPWTEDPKDKLAARIRNAQSKLALALDAALAQKSMGLTGNELTVMRLYQGVVANALMLSNAPAMKTLHSGFLGAPERRFLPELEANAKTLVRSFKTDALPGVEIHVLGPSRSEDVIRDMDPPKGESYLALRIALGSNAGAPPPPFPPEFRHAKSEYRRRFKKAGLSAAEEQAIRASGGASELAVAVALDKAVNGTSLMLILEIAGSYLLFPGDAQWGTWQAAMADSEWRSMLENVSFYKVGHHGSHNATPKDFVEELKGKDIWAMASTLERAVWPDIPKAALLTALGGKHVHVARSDRTPRRGSGFNANDTVTEVRVPF